MTLRNSHILVVDDEPDIRHLIADILEDFDYVVTAAHDAASARAAVRHDQFDAILLDIWLPGTDGITLLREWSERDDFKTPVIMISAHGRIDTAVEAVRLGAYDFLEKPVSAGRLEITIRNAIQSQVVATSGSLIPPRLEQKLVGSSRVMQSLRQQIKEVSDVPANVLIIGAPGSGKRTVARIIHDSRKDAQGEFVVLDWLASEASEQAVADVIDQSRNGTLLIPDLHTYDGYHQNRLLGLLHTISKLCEQGKANEAPRVITTTAPAIRTALESGWFKPEIVTRLSEISVEIPSLNQYLEDIPELVGYFTDLLHQSENLRYKRFSTSALNRLRNHSWGGNLSELISVLRQALASGVNEVITDMDLAPLLKEVVIPTQQVLAFPQKDEHYYTLPFKEAKEQFEHKYLLRNLKKCKSYTELAKLTGLHRTSLFRKLKEHGIEVAPGAEVGETNNNGQS